MDRPVREIVRLPLSVLTRLRLILFGHEDLASIVFWAALVGFCGALASVLFREGIRFFELLFAGQAISLVHAASDLTWWHRALVIGCAVGALVGSAVHSILPTVTSVPAAYALIGMGGFLAAVI
jgi:chloride channel protein, CIC family